MARAPVRWLHLFGQLGGCCPCGSPQTHHWEDASPCGETQDCPEKKRSVHVRTHIAIRISAAWSGPCELGYRSVPLLEGAMAAGGDVLTADFKATPYWWDLAPRPEPSEAGPPGEAETVIVGAGNVGLSAALTLARRGRQAVVLDAEAAGHGASTRNAGYLGRQVWHKYGHMVPKLGRERARRRSAARPSPPTTMRRRSSSASRSPASTATPGALSRRRRSDVFDELARDLAMMHEDGVPVDGEMIGPTRSRRPTARGTTTAGRSCAATARSTRASTTPACWSGPGARVRRSSTTARCRPSSAQAAASASRRRAAR